MTSYTKDKEKNSSLFPYVFVCPKIKGGIQVEGVVVNEELRFESL